MKKFIIQDDETYYLETLTKAAEEEWESRVGREIWDIEDGVDASTQWEGNFIRWSYNFAAETGFDPQNTLAVTIRYSEGTYITRTEIILNGELDYLRQNWSRTLEKTLLHELGHTVGLGHSEEEAIMGASLSSVNYLQQDDEEGMSVLVDQTLDRQANGYVSPFAEDEESSALACGSVDLNNDNNGSNAMGSLIIGVFLSLLLLSHRSNRQFFPYS